MMTIWRNNTGTCNHITCQSGWRFCPRWRLWSYNRTLTQSTRDESTWFGLYFTAHQLRNYMARTPGRNLKRNQQGSHHWLPRLLTYSTQDHLLGRGTSHSGLPPSITNQENAPQHMTIRQFLIWCFLPAGVSSCPLLSRSHGERKGIPILGHRY